MLQWNVIIVTQRNTSVVSPQSISYSLWESRPPPPPWGCAPQRRRIVGKWRSLQMFEAQQEAAGDARSEAGGSPEGQRCSPAAHRKRETQTVNITLTLLLIFSFSLIELIECTLTRVCSAIVLGRLWRASSRGSTGKLQRWAFSLSTSK